ncbi:lipopolysaccharide transport periplasmic protein LptA [Rhabdochromatium marinum]|uniref:lipopolysaccharide transport periplasmic protein LptA n=1 Tax=Rhabdochromatium marinum TaxID=48729 RepID=UPI0019089B9C|nr:lipopolysaccharide transport periplasmic protein LptA [Rhabdochromatium marinum]MBK1647529.1 lipopolysaccharide transport periplasmic protein LptA [Rhabdochromatium marinum]
MRLQAFAAFQLPASLFLLGLVATEPVAALDSDQEQPLFIEADAVELDEKTSQSLYIGHVDVQQGSLHIRADRVEVEHHDNRQPRLIIAIGDPAHYRQMTEDSSEPLLGRAQRMEYNADRNEITFIDQALLTQGQDRFSSDRIVYNRAMERVTAGTSAQGRERVKITITPNE